MRALRNVYGLLVMFGFDPRKTVNMVRGFPSYLRDFRTLKRQRASAPMDFPFGLPYPCLDDRFSDSGTVPRHYFHQDLLVAGRIHLSNPDVHVDVGSRIDGFVAHVASFRKIEVIDIRPQPREIPNVHFIRADVMRPLADDLVERCDSLSSLHAIEHFGLGRYGDPVSHDGHLLGLDNLHRILKKNGTAYLSVPIGPQRIEFNAHRVFAVGYLLDRFKGKFQVGRFSYVDDRDVLHEDAPMTAENVRNNFGCVYGCGIFEMTKL